MNVYTSVVKKADLRLGDILFDSANLAVSGPEATAPVHHVIAFDRIVKLELEGEDTVVNDTITLHGQYFTVLRWEDNSVLYDALEGVV